MKKYYDEIFSEQIGLDCFGLSIMKEIKSYFNIKQIISEKADEDLYFSLKGNEYFKKKYSGRGNMPIHIYFKTKAYYDEYLFYANGYEWDLSEKIMKTEEVIDTSFIDKIPFLDYEVLNIKVKYNNKWKRIIKTQKNIMLL